MGIAITEMPPQTLGSFTLLLHSNMGIRIRRQQQ
jgi:hypothetical protein